MLFEIRHRERGSVPISLILVAIFSICYSMNRLCSSFIVNDVDPRDVDSPHEMLAIFMLVLLFFSRKLVNYMSYEWRGRFKDIVTVVGYSSMPMIITYIPAIILSQFMSLTSQGFIHIIMIVGTAWTVLH